MQQDFPLESYTVQLISTTVCHPSMPRCCFSLTTAPIDTTLLLAVRQDAMLVWRKVTRDIASPRCVIETSLKTYQRKSLLWHPD